MQVLRQRPLTLGRRGAASVPVRYTTPAGGAAREQITAAQESCRDLLFRRSRQIVQDRPLPVMCWADVPELSAYGPEHLDVAFALGNLGNVQRDLGDLTAARAILNRALAIFEAAYGPEHPEVRKARRLLSSITVT
jgi:Tetratricopeptide repeat